jgi:hypothetical protein
MRYTVRTMNMRKPCTWQIAAVCIVGVQVVVLYLFGQPWTAADGTVKVWEGVVTSAGMSQHIADWYTFSHIIHGFIFYGLMRYMFPRAHVGVLFVYALCAEVAWELLENTPMVIQHYRQQALAAGYVGDSILNSVCDVLAMSAGFVAARCVSWKYIVAAAVAFEVFTGYMIRDNLTLNVLNLVYPFEGIALWQKAGQE